MAGKPYIHVDVDLLKRLYVDEQKTTREIGDILGIGFRTVIRRLHAEGITSRPPGPDRHAQLRDREWLVDQYEKQKKSTIKIAEELGASYSVVIEWLKQHGIPRRCKGQSTGKTLSIEARQKLSASRKGRFLGEANPNWRGGLVNPNARLRSSNESRKWIRAVKQRDGHKCVECGATGTLHAHHVKPWKTHPELRHDLSNGLTLCPPCHQKAHGWKFPAWVYHDESRKSAEQGQSSS